MHVLKSVLLIFQVNEEVRDLQKKLTQVESDLESSKHQLDQANKNLDDKEKVLTNVSNSVLWSIKIYKILVLLERLI